MEEGHVDTVVFWMNILIHYFTPFTKNLSSCGAF